jgi:hypothetical protein
MRWLLRWRLGRSSRWSTAAAVLPLLAVTILTREPDELRLGQRVYVDDGTCPAGQVKEVAGANLTAAGVVRSRQCVARNSIKR